MTARTHAWPVTFYSYSTPISKLVSLAVQKKENIEERWGRGGKYAERKKRVQNQIKCRALEIRESLLIFYEPDKP